jgi:hypothetical protein
MQRTFSDTNNNNNNNNHHQTEFTFLDLRTQWNETLLKRFYDEFLVPNFGIIPDELDPLETWLEALQDPNPEDIVAHVIIAFDNSHNVSRPEAKHLPMTASSSNFNPRFTTPLPPVLPPRPASPTNSTNIQKTVQRKKPAADLLMKNPTGK